MSIKRLLPVLVLVFVAYQYGWLNWGLRTPEDVKRRYGLEQAYTKSVKITGEQVPAIVVPVLLPRGLVELVIPKGETEYPLYWRDRSGVAPVFLARGRLRREVFLTYSPEAIRLRVSISRGGERRKEREIWIVAPGTGRPLGQGVKVGNLPSDVAALIYDLAAER